MARNGGGERGVTICDASGIQKHASIAADGRGGIVVVWRDERDVYSDLYAQRLDPDGKPQWRANGVPICVAGGHQDKPSLVQWGNDRFFVAWVDFREDYGEESRNAIYGQAIDLEGNVLWEQGGVPICTAKGSSNLRLLSELRWMGWLWCGVMRGGIWEIFICGFINDKLRTNVNAKTRNVNAKTQRSKDAKQIKPKDAEL